MSVSGLDAVGDRHDSKVRGLLWGTAAFVVLATVLSVSAPMTFAMLAVFLFAGPHNWMEARLLLERMPPRWGALRGYFLTAGCGAGILTVCHWLLAIFSAIDSWSAASRRVVAACWLTLLVSWVVALIYLRSQQNPRRDWSLVMPIGLMCAALAWLWPAEVGLVLVYAHPLLSLWFLEREVTARHPVWQSALKMTFGLMGSGLIIVLASLVASAPIADANLLSTRIAEHAGASVLPWISDRCLVATHTYLESLHYGVWLIVLPSISLSSSPWSLSSIPLAKPRTGWRGIIVVALIAGAVGVLLIWAGFCWDYLLMRDVYFELAMFHVLIEIPFLIRRL